MALTAPARAFAWGDGLTLAAQDLRLNTISAMLSSLGAGSSAPLGSGSGVRDATGNPLQVAVSAGLAVTVNTGFCMIQGTAAANTGAYSVTLDTVATLTCTAADTVNPRIDSVCVTATDLGTSGSTAIVQIITGTPASSPSAPSLPTDSLLLCNITVAANATTLSSGNLSDQRQFYAAAGAIKPYLKTAFWPAYGASSSYLHDIATGRLKRVNPSNAITAPQTAAFAPVSNGPNNATGGGTPATVASGSVTVDGNTSVKISFGWQYVSTSGTSAGNAGQILLLRGSSSLTEAIKTCWGTNCNLDGGAMFWVDPTPAAGTYTYSATIANQGTGSYEVHNGTIWIEAESP